ncbi:hypothetical protein CHARACLAT_014382 [Characodon lateralis]|uniref:Uncharacterized protein n=1 Tax=Characodon lateralis TaxID=208331 RepID=A0ABU7EDU7_9TELE|nr:hypothetical protein [Characodon lateralis]
MSVWIVNIIFPLHYVSLQTIKTTFAEVLESKNAILAQVLTTLAADTGQERQDQCKSVSRCRKCARDEVQQTGTTSTHNLAIKDEFFSFEDDTSLLLPKVKLLIFSN